MRKEVIINKAPQSTSKGESPQGRRETTRLLTVLACCKSNDGTTKARRYRFRKRSRKKKRTSYLELNKKTQ
jgi:hypothetical protein